MSKATMFIALAVFLPLLGLVAMKEYRNIAPGAASISMEAQGTGEVRLFYSKNGTLVDPNVSAKFSKAKGSQAVVISLPRGTYDLIGFKPFLSPGGSVRITKASIAYSGTVTDLTRMHFFPINQVTAVAAEPKEDSPAFMATDGATDPFFICNGFSVEIKNRPIYFWDLLRIVGKYLCISAFSLVLFVAVRVTLKEVDPLSRTEARARKTLKAAGLVAIGMAILAVRSFYVFDFPVLYTEDGVWSGLILEKGLPYAIQHAREDYYTVINVLSLGICLAGNYLFNGDNLNYLPVIISTGSIFIISVVAALPVVLFRHFLPLETRLLLWLAILLLPMGDSSFEVIGRISNIGFFVFPVFVFVLAWKYMKGHRGWKLLLSNITLLLCVLTNPLCVPIAVLSALFDAFSILRPVFWTRPGDPQKMAGELPRAQLTTQALILAACVAVAISSVRHKPPGFLAEPMRSSEAVEMVIGRAILYPAIFPIYRKMTDGLAGLLMLSTIALLCLSALCMYRKSPQAVKSQRNAHAILIAIGFASMAFTTFATLHSRPGLTTYFDKWTVTGPDRYFLASNILGFFTAIIAMSAIGVPGGAFRSLSRAALLSVGMFLVLLSPSLFEFGTQRFGIIPNRTFKESIRSSSELLLPFWNGKKPLSTFIVIPIHPNDGLVHHWNATFPAVNLMASFQSEAMTAFER